MITSIRIPPQLESFDLEDVQMDLNYMTKKQFCDKYIIQFSDYDFLRYGFEIGAKDFQKEIL